MPAEFIDGILKSYTPPTLNGKYTYADSSGNLTTADFIVANPIPVDVSVLPGVSIKVLVVTSGGPTIGIAIELDRKRLS